MGNRTAGLATARNKIKKKHKHKHKQKKKLNPDHGGAKRAWAVRRPRLRTKTREQIESSRCPGLALGGRQLISYKGLHAHAHAFRALSLRVLTPRPDCAYPQMVTGSSLQLYVSGVDRTRNSL